MRFLRGMQGIISSFRRGVHHQNDKQMVILVDGVDSKEKAEKLVGKEVTWKTPGDKEIKGKISSSHGNKGAVRVIFEKGMPGQSKGTEVAIQ